MSSPRTTLQDLIDQALVKRETKSINHLAKIAKSAGYRATQTTLAQIHNGTYRSQPKAPTLEAIAYLAGTPLRDAYRAAGMGPPGLPFRPAPGADKLTPKERDVVNGVIRALLEARTLERSNTDHSFDEPTTQASVAHITDSDLDGPDELPRSEERG